MTVYLRIRGYTDNNIYDGYMKKYIVKFHIGPTSYEVSSEINVAWQLTHCPLCIFAGNANEYSQHKRTS